MPATTLYSNLPAADVEVTQSFFQQYFDKPIAISQNDLNAIVAYFQKRTPNKQAANALSLAVISGSVMQDLKPMEVLDQFRKLPQQQLDTYLAYFLNLTRFPTSLIGLGNIPTTSAYVTRSILP